MELLLKFILTVIVAAHALPLPEFEKEWNTFLEKFNPQYQGPTELELRKRIFSKNLQNIKKHNAEYDLGFYTYRKGINRFSDRYVLEKPRFKMFATRNIAKRKQHTFQLKYTSEVPESIDWRDHGAVTNVKDQDDCGSCWAFTTIGSLEGQYFFATNKSENFSVQQLIDCSKGNFGCDGGDMQIAYEDLLEMGGIATETAYPYKRSTRRCKYKRNMGVIKVIDYEVIGENDEQILKRAVANHGPLSVGIEVTENFFDYANGIFFDATCTGDFQNLDHAVLLVGYGSENGTDYWIVKNSWGEYWGEKGYMKMSRNKGNNCQIASYATYPIIRVLDKKH